ncbi:MAG: HupE/UreJ family protein [Boseongicola sp.]|nr:HupE/UreJ family protein [Boseongicola sp.]
MTVFPNLQVTLRVVLTALLSTLFAITFARAHEVQPTVIDLEMADETILLEIDWVIEAPVAGLDLEGLANTNASDRASVYDALRERSPEELSAEFEAQWPDLSSKFSVKAGEEPLALSLTQIDVPEVGDIEIARISRVYVEATATNSDPITVTWPAEFGPLVLRQVGIEDGYSVFISSGGETDPIPRVGGSDQTASEAFVEYIGVGFDHIIPLGLDHILFVLGLFFLALKIRPLLWQVTAFTLAHTVTLALGALDIIRISPDIVEPLIAASIVYVGLENVFSRGLTPWRPAIVFGFGLLHGLGFASVLSDFGLGASHFVPKLIGFNVGVEIGQLAVIAAAFIAFGLLFGSHDWYRRRIANPISIGISIIALFWVFERTGVIDPEGAFAPFAWLTEGEIASGLVLGVAVAFAAAMTALVVVTGVDGLRDAAGIATSFVLFLSLVAAFTSGNWVVSAVIVAIWILAIRLQSLGGPEEGSLQSA